MCPNMNQCEPNTSLGKGSCLQQVSAESIKEEEEGETEKME